MSGHTASPDQASVMGPFGVPDNGLGKAGPVPDSNTTDQSGTAAYRLRESFLPALYEAIRTLTSFTPSKQQRQRDTSRTWRRQHPSFSTSTESSRCASVGACST